MTKRVRVFLGVGALLLVLPGCERETFSLPPAQEAASDFVAAWDGGDFKSMSALLDEESRKRNGARRLERLMRNTLRPGWITRYDVKLSESVKEPAISSEEELSRASDVRTEAPYVITYRSRATVKPVALAGTLGLVYDKKTEEWSARWRRSALWPQVERASGFAVTVRWPQRAAIKDRSGRPLAQGGASGRSYPQGAVAGSTLGHIGKLAARDLSNLPHYYGRGDLAGASGLEAAYESRLAGTPTMRLVLTDAKGRVLQTLGRKSGRPGRAVQTTLDVDVQRAAEVAYGGTVGGAVVVEPDSGNLLAVVSSSAFDPNNYVGAADVEPFNRALSGLYPPGSSMKVVTASAALEDGTVSPQTMVTGPKDYKGVVNFESGEFGSIPFSDAVRFSVNTAFAQVAEDLGAKKLTRFASLFGFNLRPRLGVSAARSSFPRPEELWDLMWGSIGQAQVLATPMQMSTVAATIANHGKRMAPRVSFLLPKDGERVVSRRTADQMNQMMQAVVTSGTGVGAQVPGVAVAGKTGTAEVDVAGERLNHAWFVAFAPATEPRVAIGLVSEYGGVGGQVAAPLAGRMLEAVLPLVP